MTDYIFDAHDVDSANQPDQGVLKLELSILGYWLGTQHSSRSMEITLSIHGEFVESVIIEADPFTISTSLSSQVGSSFPVFIPEIVGLAWVKWSNIGDLDFTISKNNIAGERPLDWAGTIYSIKKLLDKVVVYGSNGVSLLIPAGNAFGLNTIYRIGLKGKGAVAGDDTKHFFIDSIGQLWRVDSGLTKLDYSEFLSTLSSSVVMFHDTLTNLIYICDGVKGFVFNPNTGSLGTCVANITGIGNKSGVTYIVSDSALSTPVASVCTDIYDFGTRRLKTVHMIEIGTDVDTVLYGSADYRMDHKSSFISLPWFPITRDGICYFNCFGSEFRFKVKSLEYKYFEIDYIKVYRTVHEYGIDNGFNLPTYAQ